MRDGLGSADWRTILTCKKDVNIDWHKDAELLVFNTHFVIKVEPASVTLELVEGGGGDSVLSS